MWHHWCRTDVTSAAVGFKTFFYPEFLASRQRNNKVLWVFCSQNPDVIHLYFPLKSSHGFVTVLSRKTIDTLPSVCTCFLLLCISTIAFFWEQADFRICRLGVQASDLPVLELSLCTDLEFIKVHIGSTFLLQNGITDMNDIQVWRAVLQEVKQCSFSIKEKKRMSLYPVRSNY